MAAKIRRVDFSPDEFLVGTLRLTAVERGCYIIVLCLIYSRGGPVDDDPEWLAKACNVHGNTWLAVRRRLISLGKLIFQPPSAGERCGLLWNSRAAVELGKAQKRVKSARNNAEKAGKSHRNRAQKRRESLKGNGLAEPGGSARVEPNHQPSTNIESLSSRGVGGAARAGSRGRGATPRAHTDSDSDMKSVADALRELGQRGPRRGGKP